MGLVRPPKPTSNVIFLAPNLRPSKLLSGKGRVKAATGLGKKRKRCKMRHASTAPTLSAMTIDKEAAVLTFEAKSVIRDLAARGAPQTRGDGLDDVAMAEIARFSQTELMSSFGSRLREARKEVRASQQEVATVAGVTRQTVAGWELSSVAPDSLSETKKRAIADMLKVNYEWLSANVGPMRQGAVTVIAPAQTPVDDSRLKDEIRAIARDLRKIQRRLEDLGEQ